MKTLHIISSINPEGGGPIEVVRRYGEQFRKLGHVSEVATLDDPRASYISEFPISVHALGPGLGSYAYSKKLVPWLEAYVDDYEIVIIHGLWQYTSFGTWRVLHRKKIPYFVFTHGMLDPWFKKNYPIKHLKKQLYWPWAEYRVLRDACAVLFTCEEERLLARQSFRRYRAREEVVSLGTKTPPNDAESLREVFHLAHPKLRGKRVLLFLSRIQEKKGCDMLIEAFSKVAAKHNDLHLVMAGPDQSGWLAALQEQAKHLGISDRVIWPGMLQGDEKWGAFYASEVFVLPSHQENFGIVVAEALGCGLPVLISDKINIWREIEADQVGFINTDTVEGTLNMLERWLQLNAREREQMALKAKRTFKHRFTVEAMTLSLIQALNRCTS